MRSGCNSLIELGLWGAVAVCDFVPFGWSLGSTCRVATVNGTASLIAASFGGAYALD